MGTRTERWAPTALAVGVLLVYLYFLFCTGVGVQDATLAIRPDVDTILLTLVGFAAGSVAILFALPDRPFVKRVSQMGLVGAITKSIGVAVAWGLVALCLGVASVFMDKLTVPIAVKVIAIAWVFSATMGLATFVRAALFAGSLLAKTATARESVEV